MELDLGKKQCGTCKDWQGKREIAGGKVQVSPSAKGMCDKKNKQKPPHGGCGEWEPVEGGGDG